MAVRTTVLAVSTALVFGSLIYVAIEVKARPYEGTIEASAGNGGPRTASHNAGNNRDDVDDADDAPSTNPIVRTRPGARGSAAMIDRAAGAMVNGQIAPRIPPTTGSGSATTALSADSAADAMSDGDKHDSADPTSARASEASRLYDQREYDDAIRLAKTILENEPDNIRVMRVMISSACASGDLGLARTYFDKLKRPKDRRDMTKRCERFGAPISDATP